jgi:diaminopimelate decarboxylase
MLTRVVDVKRSCGKLFVLVDGGIHVIGGRDAYLGARCGPFRVVRQGEFVETGEGGEPVTICGPLCTPFDRLAARVKVPPLREGDLLVFYLAGAYGATASAGMFLSRGFPAEVVATDGELVPVRRAWGVREALESQDISFAGG